MIEKNVNQGNGKDNCILTVRTLKMDDEVVSAVEKSIPLYIEECVAFGELCDNGQWILISKNYEIFPIFVDLNNESIIYSDHKFPNHSLHTINIFTGEIWIRPGIMSGDVWKVSPFEKTFMGILKYSDSLSFVHVDREDRLYIRS